MTGGGGSEENKAGREGWGNQAQRQQESLVFDCLDELRRE
jgi:hypothetical protein